MDYIESYNTGVIIGLVIVVIIIIAIFAYKAHLRANTERIWQQRVNTVTKNRNAFYSDLKTKTFVTEVDFSYSNYYRTPSPIEIFAFKADLTRKKLAIGSFDDAGISKTFTFSEIKGFSIIDGERNTTMESYSVGGGVGRYGVVGGASSTDTYQETTVGNVKLKIETNDISNPVYIFPINKFNVDVKSERYSELVNTIEKIKSFLSKIIDENEKQVKE